MVVWLSRFLTMSDDNKYSEDDKNAKKGGEFKVPPRTWVVWIAIFGAIILLMVMRDRWESPGTLINQYKFQQLVASNQIAQATINYNPQDPYLTEIIGRYYKLDPTGARIPGKDGEVTENFRAKVRLTSRLERKILSGEYPQFEVKEPNTMLLSVVWSILPFAAIAAFIWFFFIRQIKMAGKGALELRQEQGPDAGQGTQQNHLQGCRRH